LISIQPLRIPIPMPNSSDPTSKQRSIGEPGDDPLPCKPRPARIVIALGDPAGIGAEVTLKALALPRPASQEVVLVGCRRWLEQSYRLLRTTATADLADPADFPMLDLPLAEPISPGQSGPAAGAASFAWLTRAVELVLEEPQQVLVTAPIAKASWHAAGHAYPGQTERLAELSGVPDAAMLFTALSPTGHWRLNTLLATTHIPLAEVPRRLGPELVGERLNVLRDFCRRFQPQPRLVVAGLNPHAGEAGGLGREEQDWLIPMLEQWQGRHPDVRLEGPVPPDTCWLEAGAAWRGGGTAADGYLALYHDQGLIPMKLLAFDAAVNTSLGLPFLRTSPDHGTAFAIAGRGVARAESMAAAITTAWELG
jgi:4-hydroxythreonine-4-phosphate dehydrogenase